MYAYKCQCLVGIVCGIFEPCMMTAQDAYITMLGNDENQSDDADAKVEKYFGIFWATFQTGKFLHYSVSLNIFYIKICN